MFSENWRSVYDWAGNFEQFFSKIFIFWFLITCRVKNDICRIYDFLWFFLKILMTRARARPGSSICSPRCYFYKIMQGKGLGAIFWPFLRKGQVRGPVVFLVGEKTIGPRTCPFSIFPLFLRNFLKRALKWLCLGLFRVLEKRSKRALRAQAYDDQIGARARMKFVCAQACAR